MANTQIAISKNGKTTLATAGKYCERNIDINVSVTSAGDDIPDYVKSEADVLISKVVASQNANTFTFAAITDMHYGNGNYTDGILYAGRALDHIRKNVTLDAFAVLGDYTDGYPVDSVDNAYSDCRKINSILAPMEAIPNLRIMGNHDYYANQADFVHYHIQAYSEGVTWGDKMGGYFYRDFTNKKLRIICVNTVETDNAMLSVSDAQYNWFIGALDLSAKTDAANWSILVLSHHPLDWYAKDDKWCFCRILEAYKNGTSWTHSSGTVSCNFADKNAATLIGNIHGHIHNFLVDKIHIGNVVNGNKTTIDRIATPESCYGRANTYDNWKETTTYAKTKNTAEDTSFVVYCIDLNAQSIKAFCYGAGYDREISYKVIAPTVYSITKNLTNCTASGATTILANGTAIVTVTATDGYELPDSVTVVGASHTWNKANGTLSLSNPTANVTVNVEAVKSAPVIVNLLPLATDASGALYNGGKGWKADTRLNSSGVEKTATGIECTGFMPIKLGDVIYLKDVFLPVQSSHPSHASMYFAVYDENKTMLTSGLVGYIGSIDAAVDNKYWNGDTSSIINQGIVAIYTGNCVATSGTPDWRKSNMAYFRLSADIITDDSIITVNQPIP